MNWTDFIRAYGYLTLDYAVFAAIIIGALLYDHIQHPPLSKERRASLIGPGLILTFVCGWAWIRPLLLNHDKVFAALVAGSALAGYFIFSEPVAKIDRDEGTLIFARKRTGLPWDRDWRWLSLEILGTLVAYVGLSLIVIYYPHFHNELWWLCASVFGGLYLGYFIWLVHTYFRGKAH